MMTYAFRLCLSLIAALMPAASWASNAQFAVTWSLDCNTPPGTVVGQIWYPPNVAGRTVFSYVGDASFALDSTSTYLVVAPGGILSADCNNVVPITLQGAMPCALNLSFDGSDTTGCHSYATSVFH